MCKRTGNPAIEFECSLKPSGIASTTADLHMIFTPNSEAGESYDVYKIPVEKLKEDGGNMSCGGGRVREAL